MEKQEFAQQIALSLINRNFDPKDVAKTVDTIISEMYQEKTETHDAQTTRVPIVSIAEKNGEKGVRLCVGDVDMFIDAHDLDNGKEYKWDEAMSRLKEVDKTTFSKHTMYIVAAYKDEINEKLREIGGDELEGHYWSSTENGWNNAWNVNFNNGGITSRNKGNTFTVRPVAAF